MSNYHILQTTKKLTKAQVVYHISIPNETNSGGTNYRTAVYQWQGNNTIISKVPNLDIEFPTENTAIQNGEIYELAETFTFSNANLSNSEKRDEIDSRYTYLANNYYDDVIKKKLKFWGMDRDI